MHINEFDKELMSTRVVFNEANIQQGDIVTVYKIDATDTKGKIIRHGIVEDITPASLKYAYYDAGLDEISSSYLYPNEIYIGEPTEEQWEGREHLILFKIVPGKR